MPNRWKESTGQDGQLICFDQLYPPGPVRLAGPSVS
jgi:hypothetical protein